MRARPDRTIASLITALALLAVMVAPTAARPHGDTGPLAPAGSFAVHHGPVEAPLVTPGSDGHQLGDVRVASTETTDADGRPMGRLEATLTTTAIDVPATGDEQRIGVLVFSFGEDGAHQITVQGSAHYPAQGPTIATGDVTTRPIVGGSGRFAGASGQAVTRHLEDGSWVHELRLLPARLRAARLGGKHVRRAEREERAAARAQRGPANDDRRGGVAADDAVDALYANVPDDGTGVVRTDLGIAEPGSAPGEELGLWHYLIPAGEELAPHTHPGWQLARVTRGELEYTVDAGEGVLLRADGSSQPMGPGTYVLATGDGVIENPDLIHYGANRTDEPVTIISATLFAAGEPISTLVELEAGDMALATAAPATAADEDGGG